MTPEKAAYESIVKKVADRYRLPYKVVHKTYKAYWSFVRSILTSLPFDKILTEDEFNTLRTSVNIPSLGKFYCEYGYYSTIKKRIEHAKKLKEHDDNKEN